MLNSEEKLKVDKTRRMDEEEFGDGAEIRRSSCPSPQRGKPPL